MANKQWDYIIVGGGTAGCLLANRLTTATGKRVLMLEAGLADYTNTRIRIPAGILDLFQSKFDWHFTTQNESATSSGVYIARGKVLGGSSSLNVLLYNRGNAHDYDQWKDEFGLQSWSASDVLPYFRRTEDDHTGLSQSDPKHHSTGGEWSVDHVRWQSKLSKCYLEACAEAGLPLNSDFNNWDTPQEGAGRFTVSERNGSRCSAASALLEPAVQDVTRHLTVLCGALVRRVVFKNGCVAAGVEFSLGGVLHIARLAPGGEVLMAAGAIQSPQMLMLSGIGPAEHLAEHKIAVVSNLAGVGRNLQDHPAANVSFECPLSKKGISPTSSSRFVFGKKIPNPWWILQWFFFKTGPLTSPGCDHGGFFRTQLASLKDSPSPDLQMRFLPARAVTADGMNSFATFRTRKTYLPDGFTFQSIAVRPHSRGRVRLASSSPYDKPIIEGNYLADKRDMTTLREGLRLSRRLAQQPAFGEFLGPEIFPGPDVQTDDQLDAYIADNIHTANAVVGTCRMGTRDDPLAVCDADLRVIGTKGLRVCDASVMPTLPGGQSGAATVMIAERAAEKILHALSS